MRFFVSASLTALLLLPVTSPAHAAEKTPRPRPTITATIDGRDLRVVVHGVTDYCSSDADTRIFRTSDAIRILHDRPSRASKCISTQDLTFVVKDVGPGRYFITYERMPLVAPARPRSVASAMVQVS
ncbi:MAG: hypothetical protein KF764_29485 [Labilithrix sp.]|nr:hypothetical protein [Labilithrix sp.]MBX3221665.1 hypothetical protein [Labilithrix sp.]